MWHLQLICDFRHTACQENLHVCYCILARDILWKQQFSWDLGCWKKVCSLHDFLSEMHSERTAPPVTKRANQFRRFWILAPTSPSPSNQSINTILWTCGRAKLRWQSGGSGGGKSAAARQLPPPELRWHSGGGDIEEKGIVLPELSCWTAAELPPPELPDCRQSFGMSATAVQSLSPPYRCSIWNSESHQSSFPSILLNHVWDKPHYESLLVVEVPETSDIVFIIHNISR